MKPPGAHPWMPGHGNHGPAGGWRDAPPPPRADRGRLAAPGRQAAPALAATAASHPRGGRRRRRGRREGRQVGLSHREREGPLVAGGPWAQRRRWTGWCIYNRCDGLSPSATRASSCWFRTTAGQFRAGLPARRHGLLRVHRPETAAGAAERAPRRGSCAWRCEGTSYFHLDEVEVYAAGATNNVALGKPATQSSVSQWSAAHAAGRPAAPRGYPIAHGGGARAETGREPAAARGERGRSR